MYWQTSLIFIGVILSILIESILTQNGTFSMKKAIEFPGDKVPINFAIKDNDQILAYSYQGDASLPSDSEYSASTFFVYKGELFEKEVNEYVWGHNEVNHLGYSDSAVFTAEDRIIRSYSFLNQTMLNISNVSSLISIDDEKKIFSTLDNVTNCHNIVVIEEFQNETKKYAFGQKNGNCSQTGQGQMLLLGNGYLAHLLYDAVSILRLDNLGLVHQTINVSGIQRMKIVKISTFFDSKRNYSLLSIQANWRYNHSLYIFDSQTQNYEYLNTFYNFGTDCIFIDQNSCLSFVDGNIILTENIQHLIVQPYFWPDKRYKELQGTYLKAISNDSKFVIGHNPFEHELKIFDISKNYSFNVVDRFGVRKDLQSISDASFSFIDNMIIIQTGKRSNQTKSNLCLFHIEQPSLRQPICIKDIDSNSTDNYTGWAFVTNSDLSNVRRICTVKWNYGEALFTVECRNTHDLSFLKDYRVNLKEGQTMVKVKVMHHSKMKQNFHVLTRIQNDSAAWNVIHGYRIISDPQNTTQVIIQPIFLPLRTSISFDLSVAHGEQIVSFYQKPTGQCVLQFFNRLGVQIPQKEFKYPCNDLYYQQAYQLIAQQNFDSVCLWRPKSGYGQMDCYQNSETQTDRLTKRTLFMKNYGALGFVRPIIVPAQKTIIFYDTSNFASIVVMNISTIPSTIAQLRLSNEVRPQFSQSLQYPNQFAFSSPFSNNKINDMQIVAFTYKHFLCKLRNVTGVMKALMSKHPSEFFIDGEVTPLNHSNIALLTNVSKQLVQIILFRTFLSSTNEHLISVMYTNDNRSTIFITELLEALQKDKQLIPIWNFKEESLVTNVDMADNGFAVLVNSSNVEVKPFRYEDDIKNYSYGATASIEKVHPINGNRLAYVIKTSTNKSIGLYKRSILKKEFHIFKVNDLFGNILNIVASEFDEAFLIERENKIQFLIEAQNYSKQMDKLSEFVDMYLVGGKKTLEKNLQTYNKIDGQKTLKRHRNRSKLSKFAEQFLSQFRSQPKDSYLSDKQSLQSSLYTVILRYSNFTLFCPISLALPECNKVDDITGDMLFATNPLNDTIAYVWVDQNKTQVIHIMEIISSGNLRSIQNITLPPIDTDDYGTMYTPVITALYFSQNNTLFALTVSSATTTIFNPVFYVYSQTPCNSLTQHFSSGECLCNPNRTRGHSQKPGSKVAELITCNCAEHFFDDQLGNCLCRVEYDFVYEGGECLCDGDVQWSDKNQVYVCDKGLAWYWVTMIVVCSTIVFLVCLSLMVGHCKYKKLVKTKKMKKGTWNYFKTVFSYWSCVFRCCCQCCEKDKPVKANEDPSKPLIGQKPRPSSKKNIPAIEQQEEILEKSEGSQKFSKFSSSNDNNGPDRKSDFSSSNGSKLKGKSIIVGSNSRINDVENSSKGSKGSRSPRKRKSSEPNSEGGMRTKMVREQANLQEEQNNLF